MRSITPSARPRLPWRRGAILAAALVAVCLLPAAAAAQETYSYSLGLYGGVGGSVDEDEAGFGNSAYQLAFGMVVEPEVLLRVRLGAIGFASADRLGPLSNPSLEFVTVSGEYRFDEGFYRSGVFFGLGGYRLEGRLPGGVGEEETTFGVTVGATGEFGVRDNLAIEAELVGHYLASDYAEFFATALVGVSYRLR